MINRGKEEIKEMATKYREIADILDKMALLEERDEAGEDVKEESEKLLGQFLVKMMKIKNM